MWSQFPPNLSCLKNNLPENNVESVPAKSELPWRDFFFIDVNFPEKYLITLFVFPN
jgi:hypothetical protein